MLCLGVVVKVKWLMFVGCICDFWIFNSMFLMFILLSLFLVFSDKVVCKFWVVEFVCEVWVLLMMMVKLWFFNDCFVMIVFIVNGKVWIVMMIIGIFCFKVFVKWFDLDLLLCWFVLMVLINLNWWLSCFIVFCNCVFRMVLLVMMIIELKYVFLFG